MWDDEDDTEEEDASDDSSSMDEIELKGASVTIPSGWTVDDYDGDHKATLKCDSIDRGKLKIYDYDGSSGSAEEWIHDLDEGFGGGNNIEQVTAGDNTFWHFTHDNGEYFTIDTADAYIDIETTWYTTDDVMDVLENINIK